MKRLYIKEGIEDVKPSIYTYTTVLNAWAKSNNPLSHQKSESLLSFIRNMYQNGDASMKPTVVTYNVFLKGLQNRAKINKACHRADEVFNEMCVLGVQPDSITYECMVSIWSRSSSSEADRRFSELRQHANRRNGIIAASDDELSFEILL